MSDLYARTVFFVTDAELARRFYTEHLGFTQDWDHKYEERTWVCQVSLFGFELILNQTDEHTRARIGHGRVFIGLEDNQGEMLRQHIVANTIRTRRVEWGRPTLLITDQDANEILFWVPGDDFNNLGVVGENSE